MFKKSALVFLPIVCLLSGATLGGADESHPGLQIESTYAEAVLAYQRQHADEALKLLDQVLSMHPSRAQQVQALELEALVLKARGDKKQNDDHKALVIYLRLIRMTPNRDCGPYIFEVAESLNRQGRYKEAAEYFESAIRHDFNVSASHLFLGIIEFNGGDPKKAEVHFQEVEAEGLPEMKVVAHYYLGLTYLKWGYPPMGSSELAEAGVLARALPGNGTAQQTGVAADKTLDAFRRGTWFKNVSALFQYDSNISSLPSASSAQAQASNQATAQIKFTGGIGYMSPAMATLQWIPSYQMSWNENFNASTKAYEFFANTPSLYLNYNPLSLLSGGLKMSGSFIFNNQPLDSTDTSGPSQYIKYSLTGSFGPYVKWMATPRLQLGWELDFNPQNYFSEPLSGNDYQTKFMGQYEGRSAWFNPGGFVMFENDSTTNTNYAYRSYALEVSNTLRPTIRDVATFALDLTSYNYYVSSPLRQDTAWNPKITVAHTLASQWSIIGDVSYTTNASTVADVYSYNRFVVGAGANYSF